MLTRLALIVLGLTLLPACNDMLGIYPPADAVLDGSVNSLGSEGDGDGDEDGGAD